ncbi:AMP-binding protein [Halomonas sp. ATBC28]|nr:AMP-binding protein [Halomonas sp. ATBC28]
MYCNMKKVIESVKREKIIIVIDKNDKKVFSNGTLLEMAKEFSQKFSILEGEVCCIYISDIFSQLVAFWGTILAGGVPVLVQYEDELLSSPSTKFLSAIKSCKSNYYIILLNGSFVLKDSKSDLYQHKNLDFDFIQLSSGSTGTPKAIKMYWSSIESNIAINKDYFSKLGIDIQGVSLNWLRLDHVVPIVTMHIYDIALGNDQVIVETSHALKHPEVICKAIEYYKVKRTWSPNFGVKMLSKFLERSNYDFDLSSLNIYLNAGEQVTHEAMKHMVKSGKRHALNPQSLFSSFGMAELSTIVSNSQWYYSNRHDNFVSCGSLLNGLDVKITNKDMFGVGELYFKSKDLLNGERYYLNENSNHESYDRENGWFKTGDLAFMKSGELYICGREKEVIIAKAEKIYPHIIEEMINNFYGLRTACVPIFNSSKGSNDIGIVVEGERHNVVDKEIVNKIKEEAGVTIRKIISVENKMFLVTTSGKVKRSEMSKYFEGT